MAKKKNYYAVTNGREKGIFKTWEECEKSVCGFKNAKYKGFSKLNEAEDYLREFGIEIEVKEESKASVIEENISSDAFEDSTINDDDKEQIIKKLEGKLVTARDSKEDITKEVDEYCKRYSFDILSDDQKRAVQSVKGKTLLFAVPGSGKTTVLIARTGYLLHGNHGMDILPGQIMNLTFTKAAALEMEERYSKKFGDIETGLMPEFRTIHSFCWSIALKALRGKGYYIPKKLLGESILNDEGKEITITLRTVLRDSMKKIPGFNMRWLRDDTIRDTISTTITSIKNRMLPEDDYKEKIIVIKKAGFSVKDIFDAYESELSRRGFMDFDDMLKFTLDGLRRYPDVLEKIQDRYRYWSIDETQDNSKLQNELMYLLSERYGNLFVVGDDDQSIYNFRGAEPGMLLKFGTMTDTKVLVMGTNYRSGNKIVDVSREFIEMNHVRADKEMKAHSALEGEINFLTRFPREKQQYEYIVSKAKEMAEYNRSADIKNKKTMAIIYRLNASSLPVMFWLKKHGLTFKISKDYTDIINSKIFRDVIGLMRFSKHMASMDCFNSCKSFLDIFLGNRKENLLAEMKKSRKNANVLDVILEIDGLSDEIRDKVLKARDLLLSIIGKEPYQVTQMITQNYIEEPSSVASRLRVYALFSTCMLYNSVSEFIADVEELQKELDKKSKKDDDNQEDDFIESGVKPFITLTSMHSAKGLEFNHVMIIDSFNEIMNEYRDRDADEFYYEDREEERRLFYVAATRAKDILDFIAVQSYHGIQEVTSTFITEYARIHDNKYDVNKLAPYNIDLHMENDFDGTCVFNKVYYGVRVGENIGVYTNWEDCLAQINGYSGAVYKRFATLGEAEIYVYGTQLPKKTMTELKATSISKLVMDNPSNVINQSVDLPKIVQNAILAWFKIKAIKELSADRINDIRRAEIDYRKIGKTDYHGRVDNYIINYLPVNFYKSWWPLWKCYKEGCLPINANVLEVGPGPGTTTMALLTFYAMLAKENPQEHFSLNYTAIEGEEDFVKAFNHMVEYFMKNIPVNNLKVKMDIRLADVYEYPRSVLPKYDILIESNVFNFCEDANMNKIKPFLSDLLSCANDGAIIIMIEPGQSKQVKLLEDIEAEVLKKESMSCILNPMSTCVDIQKISLYEAVCNMGLRGAYRNKHWFSCAAYTKRKAV